MAANTTMFRVLGTRGHEMRERLPQRRPAEVVEFIHNGHLYRATLGFYVAEDRLTPERLGEVFITAGKSGGHLDIAMHDAAIAVSLALQHGASPESLRHAFLRDAKGRPEGALGALFDLIVGGTDAV